MFQSSRTLSISLLIFGSMWLGAQGRAGVVPVEPKDLLALLPKAPENWKLLASRSYNETVAQPGLITVAIREYRIDPPPTTLPNGTLVPAEPKTMNLTLIDTGLDISYSPSFKAIREKAPPRSNEKRYFLADLPAAEMASGKKRIIVVGFSDRFLLTFTAENVEEKEMTEWIERLNFLDLAAAAKSAPREPAPRRTLNLTWLDELDPRSNRTSKVDYEAPEEPLKKSETLPDSFPSPN